MTRSMRIAMGWLGALLLASPALAEALPAHCTVACPPLTDDSAQPVLRPLAWTLASAAHAALADSGAARVADRLFIQDLVQRTQALGEDGGPQAQPLLLHVGELAGATHVVQGSYVQLDQVIRVTLRLVEVGSRRIVASWQAHGLRDEPFALRDEVYCVVRNGLTGASQAAGLCEVKTTALSSAPGAEAAYSEGLLLHYRGRQAAARDRLQRALELDPAYSEARRVADALYYAPVAGNEWVYAYRGFTGNSERKEGQLIRTVVDAGPVPDRVPDQVPDRVPDPVPSAASGASAQVEYVIPTVESGVWGECDALVRDHFILHDGWARLALRSSVLRCRGGQPTLRLHNAYTPAIPQVPLSSSAAGLPLPALRVQVHNEVQGVGQSTASMQCRFEQSTLASVRTVLGELPGLSVVAHCDADGPPVATAMNRARSEAAQAKAARRAGEVSRRTRAEGARALFGEALDAHLRDEIVDVRDLPVEAFAALYPLASEIRTTFVPGLGVVRERSVTTTQAPASPRQRSVVEVRLVGATLGYLSARSRAALGDATPAPAPTIPTTLGETYRAQRTPIGGRRTVLELGSLAALVPRFERVTLRFEHTDLSWWKIGSAVSADFSHWLAGVIRLGAGADLLGLVIPQEKGVDMEARYGEGYHAFAIAELRASLRLRLAERGWLSIPQLQFGLDGSILTSSNEPLDGDDKREDGSWDTGTHGKNIDTTHTLGRAHAALLASVSLQDRWELELGYRYAYWFGRVGWADEGRAVGFHAHGALSRLCVSSTAVSGATGYGGCLSAWVDWPLARTSQGAHTLDVAGGGAALSFTMRFGRLHPSVVAP